MLAGPARPLLAGAALVAALLGLVIVRDGPPAPQPASAPVDAFSAGRAEGMLRYLFGEADPHPVGSPAAARVRERLLRVLQQLGWQPAVQEAWSCRQGSCAKVRNIVGRLPGAADPKGADGEAVLLMTHYDSVAAGPGVSDAGVSVAAVLEVARALRAGPAPRHPVILLISDGEEAGLLGAQAFREAHPAAREVGAVVNLDARGTRGPSLMFETSGDSGWLARLVAAALPRPRTSSLFVTIYERLPNDTDLTVFREARVPGVNFAFIGDVVHYHTPLDDLRHASLGTLQHQGDSALAMTRALGGADLAAPPPGRAVFFDVLGLFVLRWPEPLTLPLAAGALLLVGAALLLLFRRGRLGGARALAQGLAAALLAALGAALLGAGLAWAARATGAMPRPWVAHPLPVLLAFSVAALPGPLLATAALGRRAGAAGLWGGAALLLCAAALGVAALLPGAAHLAIAPALCAGVGGLGWALRSENQARAGRLLPLAALPAASAAVLVDLPVAVAAYDAMGLLLLPAVTVLGALCLLWLAPLGAALPRRPLAALGIGSGGLAALALGAAALVPTASREAPERLPLTFYQEDGAARWLAQPETGALPAPLRQAAAFARPVEAPSPLGRRAFQAPAPSIEAPPPELEVVSRSEQGGERTVRARLRSSRGATTLALHVPPGAGLRGLRVEGQAVAPRPGRGRWPSVTCHAVPRAGIEIELTLPAGAEVEAVLSDHTSGLPPSGAGLLAARPPTAVTSHEGDTTVLARRLRL